MKTITSFLIAFGMCICLDAQISPASIDSLFHEWQDAQTLKPGVAVAIFDGKNAVFQKSYGYANLEYAIPLSDSSVFDLASLAKQFTGFAIAFLQHEGLLQSTDLVTAYLPELNSLNQPITVDDLIHHTSGLRDIAELFTIGHFGDRLTAERTLEIVQRQTELNFTPGSESDYSNTNYVLLAIIIERITGLTFRDWCSQFIFEPIGMLNSFANDNPDEIISNRAVAYNGDESAFSFTQNNGMSLVGSSAVFSSTTDLVKWAQALLFHPEWAPIFERMQGNTDLPDGESPRYGYGLVSQNFHGHRMFFHNGSTPSGFRTSIAIFPDEGKFVAVLSNWGNINLSGQFLYPILDLLFDIEESPNTPRSVQSAESDPVQLSSAELDRFVGHFLFNQERIVVIRRNGDSLTVQPEGAPEMRLVPLGADRLFFPDFHSTLEFSALETEKWQKANILQEGGQAGSLTRSTPIDREDDFQAGYVGTFLSPELDLHWQVKLDADSLVISDSKHGTIFLEPIAQDVFRTSQGPFSNLSFWRSTDKQIEGFVISSGSRLRNLRFHKTQ